MNHLQWVFDWNKDDRYLREADPLLVAVRPRPARGSDDPYGMASIGIYGLNRSGLVRERMARVKLMQAAVRKVMDTLEDLAEASSLRADALRIRLERDKADLMAFAASNQPYAEYG